MYQGVLLGVELGFEALRVVENVDHFVETRGVRLEKLQRVVLLAVNLVLLFKRTTTHIITKMHFYFVFFVFC